MEEIPDEQLRSWCLSDAITMNKKGTKAEKILKDAKMFYGFLKPKNGEVKQIHKEKK